MMDTESIQVVFETEDGEKMSFVTDLVPAREYVRLKAENAELRELVRDLYRDLAAILGDGLWMEPYESEMMELGVEV